MSQVIFGDRTTIAYERNAVEELVKALPRVEPVTTSDAFFGPTDDLIDSLVRFFAPTKAA
ncbi:MAG: hypothetical protein H7Y32_09980 [Chloroflexales bacterium]|nr:hypothetical protein [Chloroflexales bacterium]